MKEPRNRESLETLPVDIFGFIFHPASPRYVGSLEMDTINQLAATTKNKAGVLVNARLETLAGIQKQFGLTHVQLHGDESPGYCQKAGALGLKVIKVFRIKSKSDLSSINEYAGTADYFLFDTRSDQPGGTGKKFDWRILDAYRNDTPFFLSGGIGPDDAKSILEIDHPALFGLDLNSGFEIHPGLKDAEKLRLFFDQLMP